MKRWNIRAKNSTIKTIGRYNTNFNNKNLQFFSNLTIGKCFHINIHQYQSNNNNNKKTKDPILKFLQYSTKQEAELKEQGYKKSKSGRFFSKTYIDPEYMTKEEADLLENEEPGDEENIKKYLKEMEKEEKKLQKQLDIEFLESTLPSNLKGYSFSELLDEAEDYLLRGKTIPQFTPLADHINEGEQEDVFKRTDFSSFKTKPPTIGEVESILQFTDEHSKEEEQNIKKKKPISKSSEYYKNLEKSGYYKSSRKQEEEIKQTETTVEEEEEQTPEYERFKVPDDAFFTYMNFRNEVYLELVDYPNSEEAENEEIIDFYIDTYPEEAKHYLTDPVVKQFLMKQYDRFEKLLDQHTLSDNIPTPMKAFGTALELRELSKKEANERKKETDRFYDYFYTLNRTKYVPGEVIYTFEKDSSSNRVIRRRINKEEKEVIEPIVDEQLDTDKTKSTTTIDELINEYMEGMEDYEALDEYDAEEEETEEIKDEYDLTPEEMLMKDLMTQVNPRKKDIDDFDVDELLKLQELTEKNKGKLMQYIKSSKAKKKKMVPEPEWFINESQDEMEHIVKTELGVSTKELEDLVRDNPQINVLMESLQKDAMKAYKAFSAQIVNSGGVDAIVGKLNEKSKTNRSFKEWVRYAKTRAGSRDDTSETILEKLKEAAKHKSKKT
ncbi:hypothetical protein ABK040_000670 [Willaertia magna]